MVFKWYRSICLKTMELLLQQEQQQEQQKLDRIVQKYAIRYVKHLEKVLCIGFFRRFFEIVIIGVCIKVMTYVMMFSLSFFFPIHIVCVVHLNLLLVLAFRQVTFNIWGFHSVFTNFPESWFKWAEPVCAASFYLRSPCMYVCVCVCVWSLYLVCICYTKSLIQYVVTPYGFRVFYMLYESVALI